jgi:hypothetical protein
MLISAISHRFFGRKSERTRHESIMLLGPYLTAA